jgi:ferredoxin
MAVVSCVINWWCLNCWSVCYTEIVGVAATQKSLDWLLYENCWSSCYTKIIGVAAIRKLVEWLLYGNLILYSSWQFVVCTGN